MAGNPNDTLDMIDVAEAQGGGPYAIYCQHCHWRGRIVKTELIERARAFDEKVHGMCRHPVCGEHIEHQDSVRCMRFSLRDDLRPGQEAQ